MEKIINKKHNLLKLAKFHLWISFLYIALLLSFVYFTDAPITILIILIPIPLIHFILFFSTKKKNKFSRKISIVLGVLMIGAFPIGTILAMYYLPYTDWE